MVRHGGADIEFGEHVNRGTKAATLMRAAVGTHKEFKEKGGWENISHDDFKDLMGGQWANAKQGFR